MPLDNVDQIRVSGKEENASMISSKRDTNNEKLRFICEKFVRR